MTKKPEDEYPRLNLGRSPHKVLAVIGTTETVRRMHRQGYSQSDIAKHFGVGEPTVRTWLTDLGVPPRKPGRPPLARLAQRAYVSVTGDDAETLRRMTRLGCPLWEIGRTLCVTAYTVRKWQLELGYVKTTPQPLRPAQREKAQTAE